MLWLARRLAHTSPDRGEIPHKTGGQAAPRVCLQEAPGAHSRNRADYIEACPSCHQGWFKDEHRASPDNRERDPVTGRFVRLADDA
jgi:hypothetical protein